MKEACREFITKEDPVPLDKALKSYQKSDYDYQDLVEQEKYRRQDEQDRKDSQLPLDLLERAYHLHQPGTISPEAIPLWIALNQEILNLIVTQPLLLTEREAVKWLARSVAFLKEDLLVEFVAKLWPLIQKDVTTGQRIGSIFKAIIIKLDKPHLQQLQSHCQATVNPQIDNLVQVQNYILSGKSFPF